jgi:hypothetical protein
MNKSISLQSLEIFGALELTFTYFTIWEVFEYLEKPYGLKTVNRACPIAAVRLWMEIGPAQWSNCLHARAPHQAEANRATLPVVAAGPNPSTPPTVSPPRYRATPACA